jgi:hypothetical protein
MPIFDKLCEVTADVVRMNECALLIRIDIIIVLVMIAVAALLYR